MDAPELGAVVSTGTDIQLKAVVEAQPVVRLLTVIAQTFLQGWAAVQLIDKAIDNFQRVDRLRGCHQTAAVRAIENLIKHVSQNFTGFPCFESALVQGVAVIVE